MAVVYEKTKLLTDKPLHYCPGCLPMTISTAT